MNSLLKVKHLALLSTIVWAQLGAEVAAPPKQWLAIVDWQSRKADSVTHSGAVTGDYGRSRTGAEIIWQTPMQAIDFEFYNYKNKFNGSIAGTDQSYGNTTDVMVTGFKQWDWSSKYGVQLIYALECAAEDKISLSEGKRWGLGGAARWRPDAETDVALGVMLEDRFEAPVLPIPYIKAVWRPCKYAEVEIRTTGLQNGIIVRAFLNESHASTVDFTVAYETLTFKLQDSPTYGTRAVAIGEVPLRVGFTQFLESSGTWFFRASAEWVPFARHSFKHDGESVGAFQPGATLGTGVRVGARF